MMKVKVKRKLKRAELSLFVSAEKREKSQSLPNMMGKRVVVD